MKTATSLLAASLTSSFCASVLAALPVPPAASAEHARAGDRCEAAVAETIRRMRGRDAQEVEFIGAKRAIAPTPEEDLGVKGEGRYRGAGGPAVAFSYSCAFNTRTGATSGVLFRDAGAAAADAAANWQPDLSHFSPDACEAATAASLKDKYPRVGGIAFDSGTRQLRPGSTQHTRLEGRGAMVRAPGMPSMPFSYRCDFETASGKVVGVQTQE